MYNCYIKRKERYLSTGMVFSELQLKNDVAEDLGCSKQKVYEAIKEVDENEGRTKNNGGTRNRLNTYGKLKKKNLVFKLRYTHCWFPCSFV